MYSDVYSIYIYIPQIHQINNVYIYIYIVYIRIIMKENVCIKHGHRGIQSLL